MERQRKMTRKVFMDTSAWIALINDSDALHKQAIEIIEQLYRQNCSLITTEFIILEVANELRNPTYRNRVVKYINDLKNKSNIRIIPANTEFLQTGWSLYSTREDKEWSLTDCISFVVMQENSITEAFTSDHHFEQAGFIKLIREV
jgi:hypothetical protein